MKKKFKKDAPIDVGVLMLTAHCGMGCEFCGADAYMKDLPPKKVQAALARLYGQGIRSLVLGGGEPFLWSGDLWALARSAKSSGFEVQVGTNGRALPGDFARREEVDRWVLPLESADSSVHDQLRPSEESHFAVIESALQACLQAGREVTISTVVSTVTAKGLEKIARKLEAWIAQGGRLHAWHLYRFQPEGRKGEANADRFFITEEEYLAAAEKVRSRHGRLNILLRPDLYHSHQVAFFHVQDHRLLRRDRHGLSTALDLAASGKAGAASSQ